MKGEVLHCLGVTQVPSPLLGVPLLARRRAVTASVCGFLGGGRCYPPRRRLAVLALDVSRVRRRRALACVHSTAWSELNPTVSFMKPVLMWAVLRHLSVSDLWGCVLSGSCDSQEEVTTGKARRSSYTLQCTLTGMDNMSIHTTHVRTPDLHNASIVITGQTRDEKNIFNKVLVLCSCTRS